VLRLGEALAGRQYPSADTVARLDDRHLGAHIGQIARRSQAGKAGAGDQNGDSAEVGVERHASTLF
jgi:hypothetical protein